MGKRSNEASSWGESAPAGTAETGAEPGKLLPATPRGPRPAATPPDTQPEGVARHRSGKSHRGFRAGEETARKAPAPDGNTVEGFRVGSKTVGVSRSETASTKSLWCFQAVTSKQNRGTPGLSSTCSGSGGVALHYGRVSFASARRRSCLLSRHCPDSFPQKSSTRGTGKAPSPVERGTNPSVGASFPELVFVALLYLHEHSGSTLGKDKIHFPCMKIQGNS